MWCGPRREDMLCIMSMLAMFGPPLGPVTVAVEVLDELDEG